MRPNPYQDVSFILIFECERVRWRVEGPAIFIQFAAMLIDVDLILGIVCVEVLSTWIPCPWRGHILPSAKVEALVEVEGHIAVDLRTTLARGYRSPFRVSA